MTYITEAEFRARVDKQLGWMITLEGGAWRPTAVLGPGRSGAIASVYVSHFLRVPFVPYGVPLPENMKYIMIVDTAINSGRTIRKAMRRYQAHWPVMQFFWNEEEEGRVRFWYEDWRSERANAV